MVNFGPLAAETVSLVWGTPGNFNWFHVLAALLHGTLVVGVSQTAAFNRGRHLYSAGLPSRWALAHISSFSSVVVFVVDTWQSLKGLCSLWISVNMYIHRLINCPVFICHRVHLDIQSQSECCCLYNTWFIPDFDGCGCSRCFWSENKLQHWGWSSQPKTV